MRMGVPMPVQPTPPLAGGYRATLACDPHQFVQHPLPVVVLQPPPALHREVNGAEVLGHTRQIIHVHQLEGRGGEGRGGRRGGEGRKQNMYICHSLPGQHKIRHTAHTCRPPRSNNRAATHVYLGCNRLWDNSLLEPKQASCYHEIDLADRNREGGLGGEVPKTKHSTQKDPLAPLPAPPTAPPTPHSLLCAPGAALRHWFGHSAH